MFKLRDVLIMYMHDYYKSYDSGVLELYKIIISGRSKTGQSTDSQSRFFERNAGIW